MVVVLLSTTSGIQGRYCHGKLTLTGRNVFGVDLNKINRELSPVTFTGLDVMVDLIEREYGFRLIVDEYIRF